MKEKGRRRNRILYCSWLTEQRRVDRVSNVELIPEPALEIESLDGFDPDELDQMVLFRQGEERTERINLAVQAAVAKLNEDEREFLSRFYHMGQTYRELSEKSGRAVHSLESLHSRAKRKLRKHLAEFVGAEFGIEHHAGEHCIICNSGYRSEIDALVATHQPSETWKQVIRILKTRYHLKSISPQTIIGHQKYH